MQRWESRRKFRAYAWALPVLPLLPTAAKARSTLARLDAGGKREKKGWSSLLAVAATHWRSRCLMATDALFNALFGTRPPASPA